MQETLLQKKRVGGRVQNHVGSRTRIKSAKRFFNGLQGQPGHVFLSSISLVSSDCERPSTSLPNSAQKFLNLDAGECIADAIAWYVSNVKFCQRCR